MEAESALQGGLVISLGSQPVLNVCPSPGSLGVRSCLPGQTGFLKCEVRHPEGVAEDLGAGFCPSYPRVRGRDKPRLFPWAAPACAVCSSPTVLCSMEPARGHLPSSWPGSQRPQGPRPRLGEPRGHWTSPPALLSQESLFPARVVYDLLFFFIVIIIVLNLIFGVIIDTFADLRSEKQKKEEILKTTCFICGEAWGLLWLQLPC